MATFDVIRKEAFETVVNQLNTSDAQVQSSIATAAALSPVTIQRSAADDLSELPDTGGAVDGDVSYYLKFGLFYQLIILDEGAWADWTNFLPNAVFSNLTINVPTDFATPQAAIDALRFVKCATDTKIILNIESGYELPSGNLGIEREATFYFDNADFSNFWIQSEDATVPVEANFSGSIIRVIRGRGPVLDCRIDMDQENNPNGLHGYSAEQGAVGYVNPSVNGNGIINCVSIGLYSRNSYIYAAYSEEQGNTYYVDFSGAKRRGAYANHSGRMYVRGGVFQNCGSTGDAQSGAIRCRGGAKIDADETDVSGSEYGWIADEGSFISAKNGTGDNCIVDAIRSEGAGSAIEATGVQVDAAGRYGAIALRGGSINCDTNDTSISGSGTANLWVEGGTITASNGNFDDSEDVGAGGSSGSLRLTGAKVRNSGGNGIACLGRVDLDFANGTCTDSIGHGVVLAYKASANLDGGVVTGSGTGEDVRIKFGADVNVHNCETSNGSADTPNILDFNVAAFNTVYGEGVVYLE